jgi:uncharacterized membrane protein YdjX (TVP38/TMEM64 family)
MLAVLPWRALGLYFAWITATWFCSQSPIPSTLIAVKSMPPWAVACAGTLAAAFTAVVDYHLCRRAFRVSTLERVRSHRLFAQAERWAKVAPFLTIVVFAAVPLPFLLMRVLMPVTGYPLLRYVAATALGRFPRIFVIATFGKFFEIPSEVLIGLFAGGVLLSLIGAIVRRHREKVRDEPPTSSGPSC